jgi:hypothetical protein
MASHVSNHNHQDNGSSLTLTLVVDTALRLSLKLSPDVVQQLIEALGRPNLGAPHDAGWVAVVHGGG